MTFWALGDSHTWAAEAGGWSKLEKIGLTLHRLGRSGEAVSIVRSQGADVREGDDILILAGEVDLRCHVYVQVTERKRGLTEVLMDLAADVEVARYELNQEFGCSVMYAAPIPPVESVEKENPEFPIRGSWEFRKKATAKFLDIAWWDIDPYAEWRQEGVFPTDGTVHLNKHEGERVFKGWISYLTAMEHGADI